MRRQYFYWTYLVIAIVLTVYGGYSIIYSVSHDKNTPILGIVFFIIGIVMLIIYLVLYLITIFQRKKNSVKEEPVETIKEEPQEEVKEETEPIKEEEPTPKVNNTHRDDVTYERGPAIRYGGSESSYVRKVGYGPVLEVSGNRIRDMRNNCYYRIDGSYVYLEGSGVMFEISGDRIRSVSGGYLYEISGGSINKIYGGFFASVSGGYITKYDSSEKYEISSLTQKQLLVVTVLLFGEY